MSVAVCDSSGLERNICQKMKKGEKNVVERGIGITLRKHLLEDIG